MQRGACGEVSKRLLRKEVITGKGGLIAEPPFSSTAESPSTEDEEDEGARGRHKRSESGGKVSTGRIVLFKHPGSCCGTKTWRGHQRESSSKKRNRGLKKCAAWKTPESLDVREIQEGGNRPVFLGDEGGRKP